MEKMNDLKALLAHEVQDLISVEDQIIEAMPAMIAKAQNGELKKALEQHLSVTEKQRTRLDEVQKLVNGGASEENKGFLSGLFGAITGGEKCKGMEGIISEGEKIMRADMDVDVKDAAIIACAQKIEHYEICGYGTARAYAIELGLKEAESLLRQTLDEEYFADNLLTRLAYSGINEDAETTDETKAGGAAAKSNNAPKKAAAKKKVEPKKAATPNINKAAAKAENGKAASKKVAAKTSAPKKASGKK
jgi:ferritin-like metal-binding protein YciE